MESCFDILKNLSPEDQTLEIYKGKINSYMGLTRNEKLFYTNAIMQQLFHIPLFRDIILSLDSEQEKKRQKMLKELQRMFAYMKYSEDSVYDSNKFCECFFESMINKEKKEGHSFLEEFFNQVEECLGNTKYKYFLEDYFRTTIVTTYMCLECGYTDDNFVSYNSLKLNIKGFDTLNKALKAMFNKTNLFWFCKNCHTEQEAIKQISISNLPNILIIHLDRIHDNYEFGGKLIEKINDPLEFDFSLDLKEEKICSENDSIYEFREKEKSKGIYLRKDDYYKYDIQGIITYLGDACRGDYYSLIRMENNHRIKIFDDHCEEIDEKMVKYLSFGTDSEGPNGYLLVYKRRKDYPVRILNFKKKIKNQTTIS